MSKWQPIESAPKKDAVEVLVGVEIAGVWITRGAYWDDGNIWDLQGCKCKEDAIGWWSFENSVSQERLEGIYEPTHWAPMPEFGDKDE